MGYDTQIRTGGSMTSAGYNTQMPTGGSMTSAGYNTQMPTGGNMTSAGYDTQMRATSIPQTGIVTKQSPVYEVPKPALLRPQGTGYGGGGGSAFDAAALPRPRGTD